MTPERLGSSFRDPSGFVFRHNNNVYRKVGKSFASEYDSLRSAGLFQSLIEKKLLLAFEEVTIDGATANDFHRTLHPEQLEFVSYPYEWCFGQLKDAALVTLDAMSAALEQGFVIKDATAFNIQFHKGLPILIDTLSFETYVEGEPWIAYRQFCRHFLAPLALMAYVDPRLISMFRIHLDGIPLDLAAKLLPSKAKLNFGLAAHIFMHANADGDQRKDAKSAAKVSKTALLALIDNLRRVVTGLDWKPGGTEWNDYYSDTNYTQSAAASKREVVKQLLQMAAGETCWDLGANNGEFSRIALDLGYQTIGWDIDHGAIEQAYRWSKQAKSTSFLPLVQDLANPSSSIGWNLDERDSITQRGPADVIMALALIHHLAIGNNVPLGMIAEFFAKLGKHLIIEFVPKEDSQVQRILVARKDIFDQYTQTDFEREFSAYFDLVEKRPVTEMSRSLYLYRRRD